MFGRGIIASLQPRPQSAFNNPASILAFAHECAPHIVALRIEGISNIEMISDKFKVPIIGLVKHKINELNTLITPNAADACEAMEAGADYVAMECTERIDIAGIEIALGQGISVVADVPDFHWASIAYDLGVSAITTALSGYINKKTHSFVGPDLELVRQCARTFNIPIIAEGRYWTPKQIEDAHEAGAYAVCMGAAIHEPRLIAQHARILFDGSWKEHKKNDYTDLCEIVTKT